MDDQFDNRHDTGFSMTGDVFNTTDESYKTQNIPTLTDDGYLSPEDDDWREQMYQDLRNDIDRPKPTSEKSDYGTMLTTPSDPIKIVNKPTNANSCGCCYGNNGKCFNPVEKQNRDDKKAMDERRKEYEIRKKLNDAKKLKVADTVTVPTCDPVLKSEILACRAKIVELKHIIDTADDRGLSDYLKNRVTKQYENKQYELICLTESQDPSGTKVDKMEKLRTKYFELEKQKCEIEMAMMAIETKFQSEKMPIEERDNRPDVDTLIQGQDDDMDRLWALRANRRKIYAAEYNVDASGTTTHDITDFKKAAFMKKQLIAHRAREIASDNADALK